LAAHLTPEQYAEGATIIQQGDVGDKLYLIERGRVEVSVPGPLGDRVLDTLHDGDYFGEIALLLDVPRTANVRALGPCTLLALSKADFQTLVQRLPRVAEQLTPIVQQRLAAQQAQPAAAGPA
ncbi:MAG TPA: cyclic nucleotide-binding domain-containing protein, partial [Chloroflexota bacterium]|nr:cyclic nucleotide-binding domain-containing protein [Chloroflexota bacterium]